MNHLRRNNNRQRLDEEPINDPQYSINNDDRESVGGPGEGGSEYDDRLDVPLIEGKKIQGRERKDHVSWGKYKCNSTANQLPMR